jgi:hypothetical protein
MLPRLPDDVPAPVFGSRMECAKCKIVGAHARPNWRARERQSPWRTVASRL